MFSPVDSSTKNASDGTKKNLSPSIFFCEVNPHWDPRTQAYWPIALYLSFKFIGLFRSPAPLLSHNPAQPRLFYLFRSILTKPEVCILTFSNTGHSHRMYSDVSFSAPHLLYEGVLCSSHLVQHVLQINMPS